MGVFIRGPGRSLNLGPWLRVVLGRSHELPATRAARHFRDRQGEDITPFLIEGREVIVDSYRVKAKYVRSCSDFWPDGMTFDLGLVKVGDNSGPQKHGRYGVVWGNIMPSLRTPMGLDYTFAPIIWWAEEQKVEWSDTHGPIVTFPRSFSMAASSRGLTYP